MENATALMTKAMNAMKMSGGKRKTRKSQRGGENAPPMPSPNTNTTMMGGRRSTCGTMRGGMNFMNMAKPPMMGGALKSVGTRAEVMHGTAHHTSGGLTSKSLKYNKRGRIVSRRASEAGKKALRRLTRAGYTARKGRFTLFRKNSRKGRKGSKGNKSRKH